MKTLPYRDISIELFSDESFVEGSSDNRFKYENIHCDSESNDFKPSAKYGIILKKDDEIISSAIVCGVGGASGINENSAMIANDKLLVCVANKIFCLLLPELNLDWIINPDWASCFQIFKTEHGFVVHGETEISLIDINGKIIWSFSGKDIFVNPEGVNEIELTQDYINLVDFNGEKYRIDYNGKLIK